MINICHSFPCLSLMESHQRVILQYAYIFSVFKVLSSIHWPKCTFMYLLHVRRLCCSFILSSGRNWRGVSLGIQGKMYKWWKPGLVHARLLLQGESPIHLLILEKKSIGINNSIARTYRPLWKCCHEGSGWARCWLTKPSHFFEGLPFIHCAWSFVESGMIMPYV